MFGVKVPNATIAIPEYLGSVKKLLNIDQVLATAQGTEYTVGSTGAFSNTGISNESLFTYSATEHGYIMILAHIRTDNTYGQGCPKLFSKKTKFDFYSPSFASIGNVPVLRRELYISDDRDIDEEVFGYQEAWYEYRFNQNLNTGYMNAARSGSFNTWTFQRVFEEAPTLSEEFIQQTGEEVDRTIAVTSSIGHQFKLDIFHDITKSSIMPVYSVPGLKRI